MLGNVTFPTTITIRTITIINTTSSSAHFHPLPWTTTCALMQRKLDAASQPYDRLKRPRASPDHHHSAIKTWLSSIPSPASPKLSSSAESMASTTTADATPSLPPSTLRSRSSSPSRNMVYRNQNLRHANVIFTHIGDVPSHVRCAMDTVKRQANATHVEDTLSDGVLRPFYSEVRRLDMESAIGTDWRAALKKLLDDLLASHEREVELKIANERGMYVTAMREASRPEFADDRDRLVARAQA